MTPRRAARREVLAKGDRREAELRAIAGRMLADGSFTRASIGDIAEEAGMTRANFYFYFASKQALLADVIDSTVRTFNSRILEALDPDSSTSPIEAIAATVREAADLWWDNRDVLVASYELGASVPEVYERSMANFAIVCEPTVALLMRVGRVPEARDVAEATGLVMALVLMSERNYYDLMRGTPTLAERDELRDRLSRVWIRAFGMEAPYDEG